MSEIAIVFDTRRAVYTPAVDRPQLGLTRGVEVQCRVFGCYQVWEDEDINPYFVIELDDGRCTYAAPEQIRFIREADECL